MVRLAEMTGLFLVLCILMVSHRSVAMIKDISPIKNKTILVGKPSLESGKASLFSFGGGMNKFKDFLRKCCWLLVSIACTAYIALETYKPNLANEQIMAAFIAPSWTREKIDSEIKKVSEDNGIPAELLAAIVDTESAYQIDAMRYEPAVFERMSNKASGSVNSRMALASSHGLAQVMGYHAKETCGLTSWIELTDPSKNLSCAVVILKNNLKTSKGDVFSAVRMYNGSGSKAESYANKVLAKFTNLVVASSQKAYAEKMERPSRKGAPAVNEPAIQRALLNG